MYKRQAIVSVIGLGYVGLPFAVEKAKVGFSVIGIEQNLVRAKKVNQAENYISDVKDEELKQVVESGKLKAFTGFETISSVDTIVICVPTPLTKNLTPNFIFILGSNNFDFSIPNSVNAVSGIICITPIAPLLLIASD